MLRAVSSIPLYIGSYTYATLPAAASYSGMEAFVSDLGANGVKVRSNGTRWVLADGVANLKLLGAPVTGIGTTETIVLQTLLPVGAWQTNDSILVWLTSTKSGTTNPGSLTVRIGTAGTTSDTAITGLSAYAYLTAGGVAGGGIYEIKLISATSAQKLGANLNGSDSYTQNGTTVAAVATTITSAAANALYVSVGLAGGATDSVSATSGRIQLVTP